MQLKYLKTKVVNNQHIADNIYRLGVDISNKDLEINPGQFFMLRAWNSFPTLSRPISVNNVEDNILYFLYQVKGKGTDIFKGLTTGDEIEILGPSGNGFNPEEIKGKVALVAGGIGVAPMEYLIKNLKADAIDFYGGFRDEAYGLETIEKIANKVILTSDNGRLYTKGFVTDVLEPEKYDIVVTCGPEIMMKKVVAMCLEKGVKCLVSMEKHMACGVGACLGCTCKTKSGMKRSCKEGPVFNGEDVIFDE